MTETFEVGDTIAVKGVVNRKFNDGSFYLKVDVPGGEYAFAPDAFYKVIERRPFKVGDKVNYKYGYGNTYKEVVGFTILAINEAKQLAWLDTEGMPAYGGTPVTISLKYLTRDTGE